jgi:hypothetical protein
MRVLVMNHSFEQDIESLRAASPAWSWRVISLEFFNREAMRIFPAGVTAGLAGYTRPEYDEHRSRYRARLAELIEDLYVEDPFDVFVAPSDSFFYLREAPYACHRLGIPFIVIQKETTIADWNMEKGSAVLAEHAPLIADHMTVCSDRHRDYWLRAGASSEAMTVTGQPRFDFYAGERRERLSYGRDGPIALFFSYLPDFYHPVMVKSEGEGVWSDMLAATEDGLWRLAEEGYRVLVKPHPLQPLRAEERRIRERVGSLYGERVFVIDPAADTRRLIAGSDVAVGFQSTVMLEALVAGLPLVYTFWDPEAQRIKETLVPYHEMGDLMEVVWESGDFVDAVRRARPAPWGSELWQARRAAAEPQLGPLDGGASRRAVDVVEREVRAFRELARPPARHPSRSRPSLRLRRFRARERAIRAASRTRRALRI